ncbi:MAG: CbtA family protein [Hyphomicrobiaceae bacterium]
MLTRILWVGLVAGVLSGLATATLQHFTTTPLILAAEAYENKEMAAAGGWIPATFDITDGARLILAHGTETHGDGAASAWAPEDGVERTLFTSVATIIVTTGYGLILLAAMLFAGGAITARSGLLWGIAGFVVTGLAPALGLSPELPGSAAGGLVARQVWWIGTAVATAGGLSLILRVSSAAAIIGGVILLCLPHVIGAPQPEAFTSTVPSELAAHFASSALVVQAVSWALVGSIAGYLWQRDESRQVAG